MNTYETRFFPHQTRKLLKGIRKPIVEMLRTTGAWIAGGALTSAFSGDRIRDYDIYPEVDAAVECKESADFIIGFFAALDGVRQVCKTDNAVTFIDTTRKPRPSVFQVITLAEYQDGRCAKFEDLLRQFDFTICEAAFNVRSGTFLLGNRFLEDLAGRRLVYNIEGLHPISSLYRTRKYMSRGFWPSGADLIKLALKVHDLDLADYADLRREILGVDLMYLRPLTDRMKAVDMANKLYNMGEMFAMLEEFDAKTDLDSAARDEEAEGTATGDEPEF